MSDNSTDENADDDLSTLGADLLSLIADNLDSWAGRNESGQQAVMEHLRERVAETIRAAQRAAFAGDYPACAATLERASIKGQITALLTISKQALTRHDVLDAVGSTVILVIANPEAYLVGIKDVHARTKQGDLFKAADPKDVPHIPDVDLDAPEPEHPDDANPDNWEQDLLDQEIERNTVNGKTRVATATLAYQLVDKLSDWNAEAGNATVRFESDHVWKQPRAAILHGLAWFDAWWDGKDTAPPDYLLPEK